MEEMEIDHCHEVASSHVRLLPPTYSGVHLGMKPTEIGPGRSALVRGGGRGHPDSERHMVMVTGRRRVVEPDSNRRGEVVRRWGTLADGDSFLILTLNIFR